MEMQIRPLPLETQLYIRRVIAPVNVPTPDEHRAVILLNDARRHHTSICGTEDHTDDFLIGLRHEIRQIISAQIAIVRSERARRAF